jgi:hypothetical protein
MNTILFKIWLLEKGYSPKVASDNTCRLKQLDKALIESSISSSVDYEYNKDHCKELLSCFSKKGNNPVMDMYNLVSLPIGKNHIHAYKLALNKYIQFKNGCSNG